MNEAMVKLAELIEIQAKQNLVMHNTVLQETIYILATIISGTPLPSVEKAHEDRRKELYAQFSDNQEQLEKLREEVIAAITIP
mgnify:CR=1 FL=1